MSRVPIPEFAKLLAEARRGDREALGELLERFRERLSLQCVREIPQGLRSKCSEADLVQQTFLKAHRGFADFHGRLEAEFTVWLREILRNNANDLRRQYRGVAKRDVGREVSLDDDRGRPARLADLVDDVLTPSGLLREKERDAALERALSRIPDRHRLVVELRNREGLAYDAIGKRIGISGEAARKLWTRAIASLRDELWQVDAS